ncbi:MAG: fibronectin type III domain-containing protein [Bacteroidales bacterium]|nr:fibronectin type III domain-containing protein [Bacteroidales bacterium]MCL2133540.1 fibronectin type III domain-containing protein [Bacteroidales bacterium]
MKATTKYKWFFVLAVICGLTLSIACNDEEEIHEPQVPGVDVPFAAPATLSASSVGQQNASFSWLAVEGASSYRFEWSLKEDFTVRQADVVTTTSYALSGIEASATYYTRVQAVAVKQLYDSPFSPTCVINTSDLPALDMTASDITPVSMKLNWADGEQVNKLVLTPAPVEGSATVTALNTDGVILLHLAPETTYSIAAYLNDASRGSRSFATEELAAAILTASDIGADEAKFTWLPDDDYVSILSVYVTSAGINSAITYTVSPTGPLGFIAVGLAPETNYTAVLQFIDGTTTYDRGATTFTTTALAPPTILTASDITANSVKIAWTPSHAAYTVMSIATEEGAAATYTVDGVADAAGKVFSDLYAGTTYTATLQYAYSGTLYPVGSVTFATATGSGPSDMEWDFSDPIFAPAGLSAAYTYTDNETINGLTFISPAATPLSSEAHAPAGTPYTRRFKFNGTGSTTNRALKFEVEASATITVVGITGSNGNPRDLILHDGTTVIGTQTLIDPVSTYTYTYTHTGTLPKSLYLYSGNSGINLYYIKVQYGGSTPPAPENRDWDFSESAFAPAGLSAAYTYTDNETIEGLTFISPAATPLSSETHAPAGTSYTRRFKFNGTGSTTNRALKFEVEASATITVVGITGSNGNPRDLILHDGTTVIGTQTIIDPVDTYTYTYTHTGASPKFLYLYSANSGINIYHLKVTY